jgi:hypothetical protein
VASVYPQTLDAFRGWLNNQDQMVSADLKDAFDAIIAVETQLGVRPAADLGTVYSRLFGTGNISLRWGLWQRLEHQIQGNLNGTLFDRSTNGFTVSWARGRHRGISTVWGESVPAVFGQLRTPLTSPTNSPTFRAGAPWRSALVDVRDGRAGWIGIDGERGELTSSTVNNVTWQYLMWGLLV